jgi:hypothetical protein
VINWSTKGARGVGRPFWRLIHFLFLGFWALAGVRPTLDLSVAAAP